MKECSSNPDKKKHLVQLRYSDTDYEALKSASEKSGIDISTIVRKATYETVTMHVPVKVQGKIVMLSVLEARELLRELASKLY